MYKMIGKEMEDIPVEPENDFLSSAYDGDPHRFMTVHGKKFIADDPDQ